MPKPPVEPKLYHITHLNNLADIMATGALLSDADIMRQGGPSQAIGMASIKRRRIEELQVPCHSGTKVGDYVPFYFCPRSVMLYVIHCANHPELTYRGGQEPIIHLVADLHRVIHWAESNNVRWAFSLANAGARYTEFRSRIEDLDELDWNAIMTIDFRQPDAKESKQAEFLFYGQFPFNMVELIGVRSAAILVQTTAVIERAIYKPKIEVHSEWYF